MGCSQSTHVVEPKREVQLKPSVQTIIQQEEEKQLQKSTLRQIPDRGECFLIGSLSQKQQIFANVKLQSMTVNKMSLPSGGFICNNFSSILQIQKGKYFISGGINHSLTNISNNCYFYYSDEHRVQKLAPMQQARYTHASIYQESSKSIYLIGGRFYGDDSKAILSSCQKYLIRQQKWQALPNLNVNRCTSFTFIWNQITYVLGGYTGPYERSTKIQYLQKSEHQWLLLDVQLNRGLQGAILLPTNNNEITIFGGLANSGPTDSVVTINLVEKAIRSEGKLAEKRSLYKGFYKHGKVYIFGGDDNFTSEIYSVVSRKTQLIKKQHPFSLEDFDNLGFSTATVNVPYKQIINKPKHQANQQDQIVYIIGTTQEPFLCELNISVPYASFHSVPLGLKLYAHQGGVLVSKQEFILFGGIEDDSLSVISPDTYIYDMGKKSAKKLGRMNQNRYAFTYKKLRDKEGGKIRHIYCFGGATSNTQGKLVFLSACQKYSIHQDKWELISPLPQKLISPMSFVFKQNIFVFGGTNELNQKVRNIFMYNRAQDLWITLQDKLMFGLQAGSVTKISESEFYVFGGRVQNGQSSGIWSLYLNQKTLNKKQQVTCVFQQKGQLNQKKSLHKIYQPKHQDFYVIFGGDKHPLTFYKKNLEQQNSDLLFNMKQIFTRTLQHLNHKDLKGYLMLSQEQN